MMVWDPGVMMLMPWLLIFPGMALLLMARTRRIGYWTVAAGYAAAAGVGQLTLLAAAPIAALIAAAWAIQAPRPTWLKAIGHVLFVATALGLALHLLPGFKNPLALAGRMSPTAVDYRMYLNLDKALIAIWVLWAWPHLAWAKNPWVGLRQGLLWGAGTGAVCLALGVAAGLLAWEPKWPHVIPLWALNNLLLVCVAEEAFFRGYVQQGLTTLLGQRRYATWLGLGVAALLFGLAHFAAGPAMMAIAAVAGLGYGMAYQRGGLLAAILAHFALNALHLILFTYPMMR
jgi:membrane protease YdiL (CAAX protease family)